MTLIHGASTGTDYWVLTAALGEETLFTLPAWLFTWHMREEGRGALQAASTALYEDGRVEARRNHEVKLSTTGWKIAADA